MNMREEIKAHVKLSIVRVHGGHYAKVIGRDDLWFVTGPVVEGTAYEATMALARMLRGSGGLRGAWALVTLRNGGEA